MEDRLCDVIGWNVGLPSWVKSVRARARSSAGMHGKQTQVILAQVFSHCVLRCGTGDGFRAFTNSGANPRGRRRGV